MVVLLDTGFILATRNEDDFNHPQARDLMKECLTGKFGQIFVSNFVFDETATLTLVRTRDKRLLEDIWEFILDSPRIKLIHICETEFFATWELFLKYCDRGLSFTDCSILALSKLFEGNIYVATFDDHFKGLIPLLTEL
ncbi:MAG: type II toxin-antitoxin system VapC family toxin [Candidatus Heimdallarchaeota archaeon]